MSTMMSLPKFENATPSANELLQQQLRMREQADKMLEATGLLNLLGKYGELEPVGGSYAYGLLVYPDLDLGLLFQFVDKQLFAKLAAALIESDFVRKVSTADTVNFSIVHPGRPKGYWLGLEIPFEGDRWGIDCWLQKPEWRAGYPDTYAERLKDITHDQVIAILAIKHYLIYHELYGKTLYSVDVYNDVLDNGVLSLEEFKTRRFLD